MQIRVALPCDVAALSALAIGTYSAAFAHTFSASDLAAHLEQHLSPASFVRILEQDVVLLGCIDEAPVGYVQFGSAHMPGNAQPRAVMEVRRLYVEPAHQNEGLGRLLMDAALEHPRMKYAETVYLDVWEHNLGAQRFYRRYGFDVVGSRNFDVASGAATTRDLIMVRRRVALHEGGREDRS